CTCGIHIRACICRSNRPGGQSARIAARSTRCTDEPTAHRVPLTGRSAGYDSCPLPAARCPLPAARCPLPAARCPLPVARDSALRAIRPVRLLFDDRRAEAGVDALLDRCALVVRDIDGAGELDEARVE